MTYHSPGIRRSWLRNSTAGSASSTPALTTGASPSSVPTSPPPSPPVPSASASVQGAPASSSSFRPAGPTSGRVVASGSSSVATLGTENGFCSDTVSSYFLGCVAVSGAGRPGVLPGGQEPLRPDAGAAIADLSGAPEDPQHELAEPEVEQRHE